MAIQLGGVWPWLVDAVRVIVLVGAGLLVPAGVAKLRRPEHAGDALGWHSARARPAVRAVGATELALAAVVLVSGGRVATASLALAYLVFVAVAVRQRRRGASCGCFGQADAPAGLLHVAVNLLVGAAAATAALGSVPVAVATHPDLVGGTSVLAAAVVVTAVLSVQQLLTGLPELRAATRRVTLPAPRTASSAGSGPGGAR